MSRKAVKLMLVALGAATALASAGEAQAAMANSPWPTMPTRVVIGERNSKQIVLWRNIFTEECRETVIGNAGGLTDDWRVTGGSNTDNVVIVEGSFTTLSCGGTSLSPLKYNGRILDVVLGAGNDNTFAGSGDTWIFGEAGSDFIESSNPAAALVGGEGNDNLIALGPGFYQQLWGEGGSDCLQDENEGWAVFSCGGGFSDKYVSTHGAPNSDCEFLEFDHSCR
jgi:Ca2+-binding RTX toxin-like protein